MKQLSAIKAKISELYSDPANVRTHDEKNIAAIAESLKRFGQQKPIILDKSGVVRAGNGTLEAAKRLGWEEIICCVSDLVSTEMIAYAIADNRSAELAEWDKAQLALLLEELKYNNEELMLATGFTDKDIEEISPDFEPGSEDDQGKLDCLEPIMIICPSCKLEFNAREQV